MVFHITSPGIIQIFSQRKLFSPTARSQRLAGTKRNFHFYLGSQPLISIPRGKKRFINVEAN